MSDQPQTAGPEQPSPKAAERVAIPSWIKEGQTWLTATERFATALAREDGQLTADLRQVRGLRKLIDAVLERIESPKGGTS